MNKEKFLHQFNCWILAWIEIINAILKIITFTMWYPELDFKYLAWYTKKEMKKQINIR